MCDLIDLNSPDAKVHIIPKLASPLIPVPTCDDAKNRDTNPTQCNTSMIMKQSGLEDNPFDRVLCETTEYIYKKNDPFEVDLQSAIKSNDKSARIERIYSANLMDNLTSISPPHFNLFKMNKTSKEDSIIPHLATFDDIKDSGSYCTDNSDVSYILKDIDLSILNKSAMNDTLSETSEQSSEETGLKAIIRQRVSSCIMKAAFKTEEFPIKETLILPTFQRSFSQGDHLSSKKLECRHTRSITDSLMYNEANVSTGASTEASNNALNAAFIQSKCSSSNSLSSNKSSIRRLNSVPSVSSISPLIISNNTMNRGFLGSGSSQNSSTRTFEEKVHSTTGSLSDLTNRFYRLKAASMKAECKRMQEESIRQNSVDDIKEENIVASVVNNDDKKCNKPPVFEILTHKQNESYSFNHSSDSVFEESKNVNQSILGQATALAKMFEELAQTTESFSSTDDLLVNNSLWTSELVPAFEEEVVLDNVIELPLSPTANDQTPFNEDKQIHEVLPRTIKNEHCVSYFDEKHAFAKDLEADFLNPNASEANVIGTLLLDLKRFVKTMQNSKADELLENLERVLGVEGESNIKLLSTHLSAMDDLRKSPCKVRYGLTGHNNVEQGNTETSNEDILLLDPVKSVVEPRQQRNINLKDSNFKKSGPNDNSVNIDLPEDAQIKRKDSPQRVKDFVCERKRKNLCDIEHLQNRNTSNQKLCAESNENVSTQLLINLGKVLSGTCTEKALLNLLKNIKTFSNLPSSKHISKVTPDLLHRKGNIVPGINKSKQQNELILLECKNRIDTDPNKELKSLEGRPVKKKLSISHISPSDLMSNTSLSKHTSKSRLSVTKNRFPSAPGCINFTMDKKEIYISNDMNKENDMKEGLCIKKTDKVLDFEKAKSSMISKGGKSKLKHKSNWEIQRKKGPLRAVLPLTNMHRKGSLAKEIEHTMESITPPNFINTFISTLTSSTPTAVDNESTQENTKSKPIASSTPDNGKRTKSFERLPSNKHSITCDISPVTTHDNVLKNNGGSKDLNTDYKLLSPRRTWRKDRRSELCIPKYSISPIVSKRNSTGQRRSPQRCSYSPNSLKRIHDPQERSPISLKKTERLKQIPLKDIN